MSGVDWILTLNSVKSIEDTFNGDMSCITHSVVLYAYLKKSQTLLTLSRHKVMCSVFSIVEVACKGLSDTATR